MSRLERPEMGSANPARKFLNWKSNDHCFSYYDKEKQENVQVELPIKIAFLEHYHVVKGWNDKSESGIYSNEVFSIGKQPLTVKAFKGGEIAKGLYSEIRTKVRDAGGVYHRSIYAILNSEIVNLQIKGSVVSAYSEFAKANQHLFDVNWIEINDFQELKKGATKYRVPNFTLGERFTKAEDNEIIALAGLLQDYMNDYFSEKADVPETDESEY